MPVKSDLRGTILIACLLGTPVVERCAQAGASRPLQQPASASGSLVAKAEAAYHAGSLDDARRWLEQAIRNDPRSARAHALLGLVLARQNDAQGALLNLRQAYELDPHNSDCAYNYAVLLLQDGQSRAAIPILEALHQKSPRSDDILVNLARAYAETRDTQKLSGIVGEVPAEGYDNMSLAALPMSDVYFFFSSAFRTVRDQAGRLCR